MKTVTAVYTITYDTLAEYQSDAANLASYEANVANPPIRDKTLDEPGKTIRFTHEVTTQ